MIDEKVIKTGLIAKYHFEYTQKPIVILLRVSLMEFTLDDKPIIEAVSPSDRTTVYARLYCDDYIFKYNTPNDIVREEIRKLHDR